MNISKSNFIKRKFIKKTTYLSAFIKASAYVDVYDVMAWFVVGPLSKISAELGSVPVKFSNFTRGKWEEYRKLGVLNIK